MQCKGPEHGSLSMCSRLSRKLALHRRVGGDAVEKQTGAGRLGNKKMSGYDSERLGTLQDI